MATIYSDKTEVESIGEGRGAIVSFAGARLLHPIGSGLGACSPGHRPPERGGSRPPCHPLPGDPAGLRRRRTRPPERTAGLDPEPEPRAPRPPAAPPIRAAAMAETEERSLDNFFAKRDKKKKKKDRSSRAANAASGAGGSSAAAGTRPGDGGSLGSGARSGDGGSLGSGSRSGDGGTSRPGDGGSTGPAGKAVTKDEDEWKEFEQKEVDYSGLRVQAMQISEKEDDDNEERRSRR
ncbi:Protein CDV3 homolog [Lemmus lemmus]